jgi:hypothetical protein
MESWEMVIVVAAVLSWILAVLTSSQGRERSGDVYQTPASEIGHLRTGKTWELSHEKGCAMQQQGVGFVGKVKPGIKYSGRYYILGRIISESDSASDKKHLRIPPFKGKSQ